MRYTIIVWFGLYIFSICLGTQFAFAQEGGFLSSGSTGSTSYQDMLPPGSVHEGTQVLHKISSAQENLHLLAGYYYGNPRLWKKIYQDNRNVIKNPNRLPVGKTIQIQVEETWRPKFSYQEWFQLATRNGEWKPGQPWKRAIEVTVPTSKPAATGEVPSSEKQEATPVPQKTPEVEISETKGLEAETLAELYNKYHTEKNVEKLLELHYQDGAPEFVIEMQKQILQESFQHEIEQTEIVPIPEEEKKKLEAGIPYQDKILVPTLKPLKQMNVKFSTAQQGLTNEATIMIGKTGDTHYFILSKFKEDSQAVEEAPKVEEAPEEEEPAKPAF